MTMKIDEMRDRLMIQQYEWLEFIATTLDMRDVSAEEKVRILTQDGMFRPEVLSHWWEHEGYSLSDEMRRIRDRLDDVRRDLAGVAA